MSAAAAAVAVAKPPASARRPAAPGPRSVPAPSSASASAGLALRRCACGGGCPHCRGSATHPRLAVNTPGDAFEREADAAAEAVMSASPAASPAAAPSPAPPALHRCACGGSCPSCANEDEEELQWEEDGAGSTPGFAPPVVHHVLSSPGRPLAAPTRAFMEGRFGADFSAVRVHDDARAAESARAVNAHAYAVGSEIVFGAGRYAPGTAAGDRLLAHELAHTLQQGASTVRRAPAAAGGAGARPVVRGRAAGLLQRAGDGPGEAPDEEPMTRQQEIELSRASPGQFTGTPDPVALSLFNFAIDESSPKAEHVAVLGEVAHLLRTTAAVKTTVRVIGFADATGTDPYNLALSRRRADAVKGILKPAVTQKIFISAQGEAHPADTNDTVGGRTRNRRVDIRFFTDAPPRPGPLPRPEPVPPGVKPPEPPIVPPPGKEPPGTEPPGTEPPGTEPPGEDPKHFCVEHPLLCGLGPLPFLLPLICLVAPEACAAVTCVLAPEVCIPPIPTLPPGGGDPPEKPKKPEDPKKPEEPKKPDEKPDEPGKPRVVFSPVRAPNTPDATNDRVGLRDAVAVTATVTGLPAGAAPVTVAVDGNSDNAGRATVDGQATVDIAGTRTLDVLGTGQTRASFPYTPYLQLAAWWSNDLIGWSNRFAVSSLAENWTMVFNDEETTKYGYAFYVKMDWASDSGVHADLSECRYLELVEVIEEEGGMVGLGTGGVNKEEEAETANWHPTFDQHGTPYRWTKAPGRQRLRQLFRIRDMRSNSGWAPSARSGFEIERTVERDPDNPRCYRLIVSKHGADVDIGGVRSGAGAGTAEHIFRNVNCDPPPPKKDDPPPKKDPPKKDVPPPGPEPVEPPEPSVPPSVTPPCDRAELARRVDLCVEQAKEDAIDCTLGLIPFGGGWGGVLEGLSYLDCLEELKRRLMECDRKAKEDTHCTGVGPPPPPPPPDDEGGILA